MDGQRRLPSENNVRQKITLDSDLNDKRNWPREDFRKNIERPASARAQGQFRLGRL